MLQRLDYDGDENKKPKQVRQEFDAMVETKRWRISYDGADVRETDDVDPAAPWWWEGEEEASSSFLTAMGVNLDG